MLPVAFGSDPLDTLLSWLSPARAARGLWSGALLLALGALGARLAARLFARGIQEPPPTPRPSFASWLQRERARGAAPASPLALALRWFADELRAGEPRSFTPLLLPMTLLITVAGGQLVFSILASRTPSGSPLGLHALAASELLLALLLLAFLSWWVSRRGGSPADLGITRRDAGRATLLAIALYVLLSPALVGAVSFESGLYHLLGREPPEQQAVALFAREPALHRDPIVLLGIVLGAPLFEELLFRAVLLRFLARVLPSGAAIAVCAALFTLRHDAGWLAVFVLGLALSWLYLRTRSLLAPLCFHALHNGLTLLYLATLGDPGHGLPS